MVPFDRSYLIDNANSARIQLGRDQVFSVIAQSLFAEFTLELSQGKKSIRANVVKTIPTNNDPSDSPVRFLSYGQSAFHFPAQEVKEILSHQLALRTVQRWIDSGTDSINVLTNGGDKDIFAF